MKISPAHTFLQTSGVSPSLEERLADSLAEIARLIALVEEQATVIANLRQEIVALKQENLALRERLNRNSTNSNQPPSQDNPFCPPSQPSQTQSGSGTDRQDTGQKESSPGAGKKSRPSHNCPLKNVFRYVRMFPGVFLLFALPQE